MSSKLIPSNPADVMVIRNVTSNIATFSVPFTRYGKFKIGGRGTLVKLTSGALAIFSPVALTDAVKAKVTEMGGDVRYIIAPDFEHHIFISEWAKEYPQAKLIGPEGLQEKRASQDDPKVGKEEFSVVFTKKGKQDIRISDEFDADFEYEYVDAHANLELAFFYKPDRTLVEADLLFNLPATEQYSKVPEAEKPGHGFFDKLFSGLQNNQGDARWVKRLNWHTVKDRESFGKSIQRINGWDFVTLIPCHGDVLEGNAKETFNRVFEWYIQGQKH